ncbi:HAD family hydrolase [Wohlfahrtiimonas chitiniclastica]|uniref:HAD family hydrolase n=1 Tax=Wohlfahrtiimonas chitiniclastica TaxID=400946 RepID=UPI0021576DA8|nr:HAD family hydrolase [Wohlfahrtiimonas chitiniclastica]MDC7251645.1 haloacid dehalogenase [Wohlfahrtiimonas chitiniclastica]
MKQLHGAIFDVDGLLFNTEQLYCDICIEVAPKYGITTYDEHYYRRYLGTSNQDLYTIYQQDFPFLSVEDVDQFIREVQSIAEGYLLAGNVAIKPGATDLLSFLASRDIPCVIASNNYAHFIDAMLTHHGIREHFGHIYALDHIENPKPHPEIVHKAVDFLGQSHRDVVMFEDSTNGAKAAIAANVPVIMVPDMLPPPNALRPSLLKECESLKHASDFIQQHYHW